ncbi:MAG: MFS transporter [Silvibacterium sp.]|nr:MFS transporter [Silvibacterium sp.]
MCPDAQSRSQSLLSAPFYAGFVVAGMATVLLGPVLPVLGARWGLTDLQAGSLFAIQFAASTIGAVLASHFSRACLILGYASIAAGLATLALANYQTALFAFALIGAGLGSATTATNLLFGTERPNARGAMLSRVNLFWGIGAVCCPPFFAASLGPGTLRWLLLCLSLGALGVFATITALLGRLRRYQDVPRPEYPPTPLKPSIFLLFSVLLFLYVGSEVSVSGWIAMYALRFDQISPAKSGLFVSAFWISIVFGRALTPILVRRLGEFVVLAFGVVAALCGIASLLFHQTPPLTLAAVAIAGMGCAPVFPLAVARLLARIGPSRHLGWIFAICGAGAAVVPWATGICSARAGSLQTAFLVPLAGMGGVLILVLAERGMPRQRIAARAVSS